mmetsp:Transcript_7489/g.11111  ORF Transcript_7489/g.11111 Transcript_7489/m.11111 type:complete len:339 (+) Transcript_7489:77-1093(+)
MSQNESKYDMLATLIHDSNKSQFIKLQNQENLRKKKNRFRMMCQLSKERRKYFTEKLKADPPPDYNAFHGIDAFLPPKLLLNNRPPSPITYISADTQNEIVSPKKNEEQKDSQHFFLTEFDHQNDEELLENEEENEDDEDDALYTSLEEPEKRIDYDHLSTYKVPQVYSLSSSASESSQYQSIPKNSKLYLITKNDKRFGYIPEIPVTKIQPAKRIPKISRYSHVDTQHIVNDVVASKKKPQKTSQIRMLPNYRQFRSRPTQNMQRIAPIDRNHVSSKQPIQQQKKTIAFQKQQHIDTSSFEELSHMPMKKLINLSKTTLKQEIVEPHSTQSDALPRR